MLKQIMRQDEKSGILDCADALRKAMFAKNIYYPDLKPSNEVCFVNDLFDLNNYFEGSFGHSEFNSVVITRSNSRAVLYNRQIRTRLLGYDDIINSGCGCSGKFYKMTLQKMQQDWTNVSFPYFWGIPSDPSQSFSQGLCFAF